VSTKAGMRRRGPESTDWAPGGADPQVLRAAALASHAALGRGWGAGGRGGGRYYSLTVTNKRLQ
jgi:hypothetical protein